MKFSILILALAVACFAEDIDHKKRGVQKGSTVNALASGNAHQKPDAGNYQPVKQKQKQNDVQQPVSIVSQQYPQQDVTAQQQDNQHVYSVQPQIIPIHFVQQPLLAPRFQILASRNPQGQMQLTLIPHNVFMNLVYGNSLYSHPPPVLGNHIQQSAPQVPAVPPTVETAYNYVTPQPVVYSQQPQESNYYSNQVPVPYTYSSTPQSQPVVYSQPSPVYSHNNYITPSVSNSVYSPNHVYYPPNTQAKYQLLYPNSPQYEQSQNYQTIPSGEYDKSSLGQSHHVHKNDVSMHTNEYLSPPDTHFRPIHGYHRSPLTYKP